MCKLVEPPPDTPIDVVTEVLHGVQVDDPYRWLEDQNSSKTRAWIHEQTRYFHNYLQSIPGRERIREMVRDLLDRETYDSFLKMGRRYFFRKRLPGDQQPSIYIREGFDGPDQLLVDPATRGAGPFVAVKPVRVSPDCRLLLYEVKDGGERTGTFELLNIETGERLGDKLPRGILRGLIFAPDGASFYYSLELTDTERPAYRAVYRHVLGTCLADDEEVFFAGEDHRIRLFLIPAEDRMGIYLNKCFETIYTDLSLRGLARESMVEPILTGVDYRFEPRLLKNRIIALTSFQAENLRIVELMTSPGRAPQMVDIVPEGSRRIRGWTVVDDHLFVSVVNGTRTEVHLYDMDGRKLDELPVADDETVRLFDNVLPTDELLAGTESFTRPPRAFCYSIHDRRRIPFAEMEAGIDDDEFEVSRVAYESKDGTSIPMSLVGRREALESGVHPVMMTSYGGFGNSQTPRFSVLVTFFLRQGCLFALPNIRGGSEFGTAWHTAAKRQNRQTAYDDFLSAAEWLIETGRTRPDKLAIFGGSNSGLLVAVAMTQRPRLFGAVLCLVPLTDMLRFHLFDRSHIWRDEFGTADDPTDLRALLAYSPYHNIHSETEYPATMIVSGDLDAVCNALHARKMTARLQAARPCGRPVLLDYDQHRGHSPVLPLSLRIEALTDRIAFLSDQLALPL